MKKQLLLFLIFCYSFSYSQLAIIKDKDGYTNVRKENSSKSKIIYKLKENQAFWYNDTADKEWVEIYIPKDKFCINQNDDSYISGYIHKSRLQPIQSLSKPLPQEINFNYKFKKFEKLNHINDGDETFVSRIDGKKIWGTDGNFPAIEIEKISLFIDNKRILIHEVLFNNLYECNGKINFFKKENTYFIYQLNSDGAGTYELLWVIDKEKGVKQRLVGTHI